MAKTDPPKADDLDDIPHVRKEPRPDFSQPLPRGTLRKDLQDLVDRDETLWEELYDGTAPDSTDSSVRYAAYATRARTLLRSAQRYVAYTSDIGESFRPVAHPYLIRSAYAVSWAYLGGDVAHEGYKAWVRQQRVLHPEGDVAPGTVPPTEDYRTVMAERAVFQGLASMGLPAFTIHSIVRYSGRALKEAKNARIRTWGPIGVRISSPPHTFLLWADADSWLQLGLAAVPFLPYIFDKPVEEAVGWTFHKAFETLGGPEAAKGSPPEETKKEL
ncbi:MAG: hypothetical protein M1832_004563 [Thelocarpon impressellum]|nr:MAG: hypothetical protein M1832_004563 [Thelocarpon impressellum]